MANEHASVVPRINRRRFLLVSGALATTAGLGFWYWPNRWKYIAIGNGNGIGLGEVESDWRRQFDIWGTHVSANNKVRNFLGIGICLVGNFEQTAVPAEQITALVTLTRTLMDRYGIAPENVSGHGMIHGESTKCPGRHFPMSEFMGSIRKTAQ